VRVDDTSVAGTIENFGSIAGTFEAIYVHTASNIQTLIGNAGVLAGGTSGAIYADSGSFQLINGGIIQGKIWDFDNQTDSITNFGHIYGDVFLGGNSVYVGTGGTSGAIHVGNGNAKITGGAQADRFVFDAALSSHFATITNFTPQQHDKIVLSETDFAHIGAVGTLNGQFFHNGAAVTVNQHIIYVQSTGFLYYDSNGSGVGGAHHIGTLSSHPALTNASFVVEA
jgi:Ca2+-binding RTX toxin-like protein